jgi:hypothetical protein
VFSNKFSVFKKKKNEIVKYNSPTTPSPLERVGERKRK